MYTTSSSMHRAHHCLEEPYEQGVSSHSIALDKAGIQVKARKVEFGAEEITFHNYRVIGGDGPLANPTANSVSLLDSWRFPGESYKKGTNSMHPL
jgi:hypothetical protein